METNELVTAVKQAIAVNDFPLAEEYTSRLIEAMPDNPAVYLLLGTIYTRKKEYIKAIDALQHANTLEGGNPEILNNLAIIYKKSGALRTALETINKAYKQDPENAEICYNIANIYKESGKNDKAASFYKKAIDLNPKLPLACNNLGTLLEEEGAVTEAVTYYRKGLEVDPNNPTLHFNLGNILLKRGDRNEAVEEFRKAVRGRPGWVAGLNNLGAVYLDLGRLEDALHSFRNALTADPENPDLLNNIGLVLTKLGRYEEAEGYLNRALEKNPAFINAAVNLGRLQDESGRGTGATDVLKSIISSGNDSFEAKLLLGKLLIQKERFTEAYETIRNALRKDPDSSEGNTLLGILYLKTGKKDRARGRFDKAAEISPSNLEARYHRALLLQEAGKFEESLPDLEYIYRRDPDFYQTKRLLAENYLQTNHYDGALELLESLKESFPDDEDILKKLVFLYKNGGEKEKALEEAEKLVLLQDNGHVERMEDAIDLYEEIVNDFEKEYESIIDRNIEIFLDEVGGLSIDSEQKDEESLFAKDLMDLEGEVIPIIDFGGIEPIIEVNEEDKETINLSEMEEVLDLPDEEEDIETIKAALIQEQARKNVQAAAGSPGGAGSSQNPGQGFQPQFYPPNSGGQPPYSASYPPPPPQIQYVPMPQVIVTQPPQAGAASVPQQIVIKYEQPQKKPEKEKSSDRRKENEYDEEAKTPAELLGYLENLTSYLPEEKKESFEHSDMKLKIEALKAKMTGHPGLARIIEEKYGKGVTLEEKEEISREKVESTFKFMNNLTDYLPDKSVSLTMKNKIDHILEVMKGLNGKGKTT